MFSIGPVVLWCTQFFSVRESLQISKHRTALHNLCEAICTKVVKSRAFLLGWMREVV